ncbi:MAG TPA: SDR family oxidoreductase [Spirochaetota bacterium]|nr:SDR family oxidoreductase [Spirochaetota bacterium]HPC39815.1 SDR family oxidoreductase [Spirochaetota bacterium]HPL16319.1 SDR family oxidoreductase [Spirochaetota bacterium]HQF09862.1 SDR family oxidoreductase [Spirochaetota bacterium]HQH98512.1 SDR family oxidoreductase [Spirochaetota bacterium]
MKNPYKGKTAIVTGGASGMGRSLCRGLAARGARVVVADINGEEARRAVDEINAMGCSARAITLDVGDESAVFRAVEEAAAELGSLDYYVNNAGIGISADARDLTIGQWRKIFDVNLFGVLYGTMAAYAVMARQGSGHIVNVASMAGFAPFSINAPYTAAKYGVVGLSQALRHEMEGLGVRMTLVCPGIVRTSFYDAIEIVGTDRETYMEFMPRRLITPDRAAEIILDGVAREKTMIIFPFHAKVLWWISRFAPSVMTFINRKMVREYRSLRK